MRKINVLTLILFLGISLNSFSSEKELFTKIDTLKKTEQYLLFSKTSNINDVFLTKIKNLQNLYYILK